MSELNNQAESGAPAQEKSAPAQKAPAPAAQAETAKAPAAQTAGEAKPRTGRRPGRPPRSGAAGQNAPRRPGRPAGSGAGAQKNAQNTGRAQTAVQPEKQPGAKAAQNGQQAAKNAQNGPQAAKNTQNGQQAAAPQQAKKPAGQGRRGRPRKDAARGAAPQNGSASQNSGARQQQNGARPGNSAGAAKQNLSGRRGAAAPGTAPVVRIYPLGGLGEVGKNITLYECEGDMILVDCGLVFPDSEMFGIDLVIPDFTFVRQNKDRIKGVVITHGHEDHIGSLPYLLKEVNLPIYATRLTIGLIRNKLEEHGLNPSTKCIEIAPKKPFKLGCFSIEPIHVHHSIPDAVALAISCPAGVILQTGDFKIDYTPHSGGPTDLATIGEYGQKGVLALLSDSTNSERPGFTATEQKVAASFAALFARAQKKRIIIATFASNLYRVQQIVDMAVSCGRKVAVSGRSMVNNTQMAMELGYLHVPETVLIDIDDLGKYPPEKVVLITTGSQGEPLSALSRMSSGSHRSVRVGEGDFIIISANPIPGNEKMVTKVVNGLLKLGAEVIYESMYDVHVSGHACQEEQKLIITLAHPQFFLPVHGEYKHLKKHAQTAASVGIPQQNIYIGENGDCIQLSRDGMTIGEPVPAGAVMVDGLGVGDVGNIVMRDRRHLSEDGLVIVVATVDTATGRVLSGPDLVSRGFVYVRENEELMDGATVQVRELLERISGADMRDWNSVKTRIREAVSSYLYRKTKRSPMILPILMEV